MRWAAGSLLCCRNLLWSSLFSGLLTLLASAVSPAARGGPGPEAAATAAKADLRAVLAATPNPAAGAKLFQICTECHGPHGDGNANGWPPEIAGQHPRVVAKELTDFRAGVRWYDPMERIAGRHVLKTAQDIADVAAFVGSLPPSTATAVGAGRWLEQGGRVYAQRCQWCHGAQGEGSNERFVPRVAGQQFEYLLRQLHYVVEGRRSTMRAQHSRLLERADMDELTALADYMSRLGRQAQP
jgi:cytochrome c553